MDERCLASEKLFSDGEILKNVVNYLVKLDFNNYRKLCIHLTGDSGIYKEECKAAINYVYDNISIINRILLPETRIKRLYKSQLPIVLSTIKETTPETYSLYNYICKN